MPVLYVFRGSFTLWVPISQSEQIKILTSKQISNNFLSLIYFPEKTDVYQGDPPMLAVVPAPDDNEDAELGTRQLRVQIGTNDEM